MAGAFSEYSTKIWQSFSIIDWIFIVKPPVGFGPAKSPNILFWVKSGKGLEDVQAVKDGVELIYNKFLAFLLSKGVKVIPTENEAFDTEFHEAITTFPAPSEDLKGKIIDCASKGYTLNDKVIRFSKVVVGE